MAAVSPLHAPGTLTPPRSPTSVQRPWEPQSPPNSQKLDASTHFQRTRSPSQNQQIAGSQLDNSTHTSNLKPSNPVDSSYLQPSRVNTLGRKDSNISTGGSEGDSLLDMYGNTPTNRSATSMDQQHTIAASGGIKVPIAGPEVENSSRWIHRDKLARIESRELREAGIHIGPQSRSTSRQMRPRSRSRERVTNGTLSPLPASPHTPNNYREDPRLPRHTSPLPTDEDAEDAATSFDLRLPEEAAADPHEDGGRAANFYRTPSAKQSFSRIPLSTSSPIPIPQDYIARNAPLQRTGSNGWSGEDELFGRSRSRSHSIDSQVLLNDDPSTYSSSPSKKGILPKPRKTSANRTPIPKTRSRSTTTRDASSGSRPGTRSGETPPGSSSSRRPEGDPPWLAHTYAPDPRLPQDQQLLPTVAKRLKQEQWEREGKVGSVYDREFNPLALQPEFAGMHDENLIDGQQNGNGGIKPQTIEAPAGGVDLDWPLKSPKSPASVGRPGTSGTDHGGYKTMPTIAASPKVKDPFGSKTLQPIRVQEPSEDEPADAKAKKGCCCVIM
ncbi:MAG: hypothetical protein M1814_005629 [Vezdaea aestivalis]|nr:MAG: hypothetical protein M1814_005629 [Vezdaea aestivalis]